MDQSDINSIEILIVPGSAKGLFKINGEKVSFEQAFNAFLSVASEEDIARSSPYIKRFETNKEIKCNG